MAFAISVPLAYSVFIPSSLTFLLYVVYLVSQATGFQWAGTVFLFCVKVAMTLLKPASTTKQTKTAMALQPAWKKM